MKLLRQELARSAATALSQPKALPDIDPQLCITLNDGTILLCAPPSQDLPPMIAGLSLLHGLQRQRSSIYLGSRHGPASAMASSETRTGVIRSAAIPRVVLSGKRYMEFRLQGSQAGDDESITSLGSFQLFGSDTPLRTKLPTTKLIYSVQTDRVNGLLGFWADPLYRNGWDFVMLVPEEIFPKIPSFLFYNIDIHHVCRDLQISLIAKDYNKKSQPSRASESSNTRSIALALPSANSEGRTTQPNQEHVMSKFLLVSRSFLTDERAVTSIEYGLIAALIGVALVTILGTVGDDLVAVFTAVSTELQAATAATPN
jgi:pilus assembly protein Flp/PilA